MVDTLVLNGREVRVEANWNAVVAFLEATGQDNWEGLTGIGKLKPSDVAPLMAACINEGERLEGRESHLSPLDVGAIIRPKDVEAFMQIYVRQSAAQVEVDGGKKQEGESQES